MPLPLLALAAAAPSIFKGVQGLIQGAKGRKMARNNPRPTYEIPKEFQQNLAIAENAARVGLPQQQVIQAQQGFARNQNAGLRQLGRLGRPGGVAGVVRAGNDAALGLSVADAQARMGNQRQAMGYRSQIGQQQLAKQQWDKFGKYNEQADAAAALQGAGRQNVYGGLNDLSQLGQYAFMGAQGQQTIGQINGMPNLQSTGNASKFQMSPSFQNIPGFNQMPATMGQINGLSYLPPQIKPKFTGYQKPYINF